MATHNAHTLARVPGLMVKYTQKHGCEHEHKTHTSSSAVEERSAEWEHDGWERSAEWEHDGWERGECHTHPSMSCLALAPSARFMKATNPQLRPELMIPGQLHASCLCLLHGLYFRASTANQSHQHLSSTLTNFLDMYTYID
jgi:hypothetical protein